MMTPQEVSEHAFAKATFGGYNMAMVDEFLDALTVDYTTLYKENATLKSKMKVLVDKVEEYRSTEDAMRKALLTAQRMADNMVAEAEKQKAELLHGVESEIQSRRAKIQEEIAAEEGRLAAAKEATAAYLSKLRELYAHEMEYLNGLSQSVPASAPQPQPAPAAPQAAPATPSAPAEEPVAAAPADDKITVEVPVEDRKEGGLYAELMELNMSPAEGERHKRPTRQPIEPPQSQDSQWDDPDDTAPTRRIDFSNLQFGREYELK